MESQVSPDADYNLPSADAGVADSENNADISVSAEPDRDGAVDRDVSDGDTASDSSRDAESGEEDALPDTALDAGTDAMGNARLEGGAPCATAVSAGMWHTCAIANNGVHCWGYDVDGELGDGTTVTSRPSLNPTPVLVGAKALSAGGFHTCALMTNGGVRCWGNNGNGALGIPGPDAAVVVLAPPSFDVLTNVSAVAAGYDFTCALTGNAATGGGVRCWGTNLQGQLGIGSMDIPNVPVPPTTDTLTGIKAIATGYEHACVLRTNGGVRCWGGNGTGQLGVGTTDDVRFAPPAADVLTGATAIAAGTAHTCAAMATGGVLCWGNNASGQLGDGTMSNRSTPPTVAVLAGTQVAALAAGYAHTCALTAAGAVFCWGDNTAGQLATDPSSFYQRSTPGAPIDIGDTATAITTGDYQICVLTSGNDVLCWGSNNNGQLGDTTTAAFRPTPGAVVGLSELCR